LALKISESLMLSQIASLKNRKIKILKIRTDDLISIIPFAILPIGNSDIGDVFSIKFQGLNDKKVIENPVKTFKAFGVTKAFKEFPALRSVNDEVLYISKISQKSNLKSAYIDADFSKKNLIEAFNSGVNTIHIASHYSSVKTLGSSGRLLLGDGSTISLEDLNFEINSQSNTSLLTLSACDTGLRTSSDGMSNLEGLSNVFNLKGINNVLGTLWAVSDDSTADFMRLYYLITEKNDVDPVTALTLTQRVFKFGDLSTLPAKVKLPNDSFIQSFKQRISKYTHPFHWAAFQLVSN
jgi:CHAT domain-containing protein